LPRRASGRPCSPTPVLWAQQRVAHTFHAVVRSDRSPAHCRLSTAGQFSRWLERPTKIDPLLPVGREISGPSAISLHGQEETVARFLGMFASHCQPKRRA
jgi:hypothetical protein